MNASLLRWDRFGPWSATALGCLAVVLLPCLHAPSDAQPTRVATGGVIHVHLAAYDGRHDGATRFRTTFVDLEARVDRHFEFVRLALGLKSAEGDALRTSIHVHVRDADCKRWGLDRARCTTIRKGGLEHHHIDIFAEYFLSGDSDLEVVLRHELVHAVMRARMGGAKYQALPHWVREGLAVHIAGEGRHHLRRTLLAREDVDALMTGLMGRQRSLVMYPYAWLAVEYLRLEGGPDAVCVFARGLMDGRHPRALTRELTGKRWKPFLGALRGHARKRIEEEAAGLADLKRARVLYRQRRFPEARVAFGAFLEAHPGSAFAPTARYYCARTWYRERNFDAAASAFQGCIDGDLGTSGWIDECHLYLGIARYEQARDDDAVVRLRDYLDLYPYSDQHDLGYLALGRTLVRLGRSEEAREAFEAVSGARRARSLQRVAAARELAQLAAGEACDPGR